MRGQTMSGHLQELEGVDLLHTVPADVEWGRIRTLPSVAELIISFLQHKTKSRFESITLSKHTHHLLLTPIITHGGCSAFSKKCLPNFGSFSSYRLVNTAT